MFRDFLATNFKGIKSILLHKCWIVSIKLTDKQRNISLTETQIQCKLQSLVWLLLKPFKEWEIIKINKWRSDKNRCSIINYLVQPSWAINNHKLLITLLLMLMSAKQSNLLDWPPIKSNNQKWAKLKKNKRLHFNYKLRLLVDIGFGKIIVMKSLRIK